MRRWLSACAAVIVAGLVCGATRAQDTTQNASGGAAAQSPAQAATGAAATVQPKLVHMVKPVYPDELIQGRFTGTAVVRFTIAKDGSVRDVKAVTTNHFSEISVAAVQQWTFEPMQKGGEAVDSDALARIVFTVEFTLGTNHASSSAVEVADNGAATAKAIVAENSEASLEPAPASAQPAPSNEVTEAKLLHSVSPSYHVEADGSSKGGTVVVKYTIQADGTVSNVKFVSGPEEYGDAAVAAVKQWTYEPARVSGHAVPTEGSASFVFKGSPSVTSEGDAAKPDDRATSKRVKVAGNVIAKQLVHQVQPIYPQQARLAREQGTVVLHAIIGTDGTVKTLRWVSGPEHLIVPAMDAVKQWRYKPTLIDGEPVEVDTTIAVIFNLF
jgi:TonB family protein